MKLNECEWDEGQREQRRQKQASAWRAGMKEKSNKP
jgi:hypothetical protein